MEESTEFVLQNNHLLVSIMMIAYLVAGTVFNAMTDTRHHVAVDRIGYILILVAIILAPNLGLLLAAIAFILVTIAAYINVIRDYPELGLLGRLSTVVTIALKEIFR